MRYKWKTKPYAHQVKAIRKLVANGWGGALLMAPRTGKTKVAIDYASMLTQAGRIRKVLIVCPNKVMGTWVRQIHLHCPWYFTIQVWDKDARKSSLTTTRAAEVEFVIVNYEAFGVPGAALRDRRTGKVRKENGRIKRSKTRGGRYAAKREIVRWIGQEDVLGILDESHRIKNPSGRSANMVVSLSPFFRYRVLMTGTPVTKAKRAFDVYMQWKWLNPARFADWPTVESFKNMTGRWIDRNGYPQWIGPREQGMRILRERIHADSYAITRDECFDLPKSDVQPIKVKLTGESARVYDAMAENMVAELRSGEITEASIALVLTMRLAQITSGFTKTTPEYGNKLRRIGRDKLNALEELMDDAVEHDEKLIVVARFKPDLNAIARMARDKFKVPTFELRGGVSTVDQDLIKFERYDGCAVYVCQPQAASLGVDLSTASRMIWYSLTSSWVDWTQMCDRIALSRVSTTFTYLLGGPVDEVMYQALQSDTQVAKLIMRKPEVLLRAPARRVR